MVAGQGELMGALRHGLGQKSQQLGINKPGAFHYLVLYNNGLALYPSSLLGLSTLAFQFEARIAAALRQFNADLAMPCAGTAGSDMYWAHRGGQHSGFNS